MKQILVSILVALFVISCGKPISREEGDRRSSNKIALLTEVEEASFQWIQAKILNKSCVGCHQGSQPAGKVDLTSYDAVMKSGSVVPGNPEKSSLFVQVNLGKMPKKKPKLLANQIDALNLWIKNGALNN